ncbi:MAG: protein kinase, partial [Myxococcota bacterium]|nr:protein kinase [Myxococcota bacterium]
QALLASIEARVRDLIGIEHSGLLPVLDWVHHEDERLIVTGDTHWVTVERILSRCRSQGTLMPHNVFLHLATQICTCLEVLHSRPGRGTGAEHVLHMRVQPNHLLVGPGGKVMLHGYGLHRSPTSLPHGLATSASGTRMDYLSPEQTHPDQKLSPSSDIFSLGAVLYEMLSLEPMFRADSNLQTIHSIRRAEVTQQLLRIKQVLPGLDKVLYRSLGLNPRHRYQRAFVLREDLRGLMSGYSFTRVEDETRTLLQPLFDETNPPEPMPPEPRPSTAMFAAHALAERLGGRTPSGDGDDPTTDEQHMVEADTETVTQPDRPLPGDSGPVSLEEPSPLPGPTSLPETQPVQPAAVEATSFIPVGSQAG